MSGSGGQSQGGASLFEFAVILPVFLALVLGIVVYGIGFVTQQAVNHAAERGAAVAVAIDPGAADFSALAARRAEAEIARVLGFLPGDAPTLTAKRDCTGETGGPDSYLCISDDLNAVRQVRVRLSPRFDSLWPGLPVVGLLPTPEFVRATGVAVVAPPASGGP